jgi:23S rRNA-/tRNA-specific pseudouridylate synthase
VTYSTLPFKQQQHPQQPSLHHAEQPNLSVSSQILLSRYDRLSPKERIRFHQKVQAEAKASQPLQPAHCLHVLYIDQHICVTVKPSGILSVPGPRQNPSLAQLVYEQFPPQFEEENTTLDQTVVHRLDMDTSGIILFARSKQALQQLQADFRPQDDHKDQRRRIHKVYHALVEGRVPFTQGEIDVAMERDPSNPPFMRVAQPKVSQQQKQQQQLPDPFHDSPSLPRKWLEQAPKPSWTEYQVLSHEYISSRPVTRLALTLHTGRTHQLRVHCAQVLQHAIVGDEIYGTPLQDFRTTTRGMGTADVNRDKEEKGEWSNSEELITTPTNLCLHAFELRLYHPITRAPMIFQAKAPF